ncbi:thymidine phosphorylase [Rhizobium paknamense]|uniref:Thymidine phosphorylase n=1 Tax=Rhizobium paknamense TaxID=1206817 RepID=A0ABU0IAZ7_9HYPH|nr:thymidine phosphorylase [Rhizobium paknamense]MDQ0455397.1 thymidine phosphorylase [Rhizobium paknamense]
MLPQEIIRRKRDGQSLSAGEIRTFIEALSADRLSEGQIGAFAMAVFLRGMSRDETVALTLAMRDSGTVLAWNGLDRPISDKHSTGGVGDNISLMLAPLMAACGLAVPMISGRGLGHTGGTLDKLQSIPGYEIQPSAAGFRKVVAEVGTAIIGQTGDLAPADKRLYAVRDVTATVESVPLITASILSKKLAAGLTSLVLDVKVGNGAFMSDMTEARTLAEALVEVANGAGMKTTALLTDMNEPLADAAGNAVEVLNAVSFLKGEKTGTRLEAVTLALGAEMLVNAGVEVDRDRAEARCRASLKSGAAAEVFARMVHGLGGPHDFLERAADYLPSAPVTIPVLAGKAGYLASVKTRDLGLAVIDLGGGRRRPTDTIDPSVGFSGLLPLGTEVARGDVLGFVHAAEEASGARAADALVAAYAIEDTRPMARPVVIERIED